MGSDTTIACGIDRKGCETLEEYPVYDPRDTNDVVVKPKQIFMRDVAGNKKPFIVFAAPDAPVPAGARRPTADEMRKIMEEGWAEEQGYPFAFRSRYQTVQDPYRLYLAKDHPGRIGKVYLYNDYNRITHGDNIDRTPFTLKPREAEALVEALELDEFDMPCKKGACVKEGASGYFADGKYYFTKDPERLEHMIAKLADRNVRIDGLVDSRREELLKHLLEVQKKAMVGREIASAQLDSMKGQKLIPWFFGISTLTGIVAAGASVLMYKIFKKQSNDQAETDGRKVTVEDLTIDRTKELREEFDGGKGVFRTPYRDSGLLGKAFEVFRNTNPKYKNYALIGWTDSGKSFFVEQGLPQAIVVEEYLLDHPEKAAELTAKGYPRVPEQHRAWLQEVLAKGRKVGKPGFMEVTIDMGELMRLGAVWKGKEDVMVQKIVKFAKERSALGLFTNIHLDESKRAASESRSADNTLTDVSIIEKLKKACEIPFVSVSQGTTPAEYAFSASDVANSTRYQPVLAREASPTEIMARLRADRAIARDLGVTSATDGALKAIVVLSRELKPTSSYNASSAQLMNAVAQFAQFRGQHEITLELFNEYYAANHLESMGPHTLTAQNLDAHVAQITKVIDERNADVLRILSEFNRGNISPQLRAELKLLDAVRYTPQAEFFGAKPEVAGKQVCEAPPADVFTGEEQVSRMETGAQTMVDGTPQVDAAKAPSAAELKPGEKAVPVAELRVTPIAKAILGDPATKDALKGKTLEDVVALVRAELNRRKGGMATPEEIAEHLKNELAPKAEAPVAPGKKAEQQELGEGARERQDAEMLRAFFRLSPGEQERQRGRPGTEFVKVLGRDLPTLWIKEYKAQRDAVQNAKGVKGVKGNDAKRDGTTEKGKEKGMERPGVDATKGKAK